MELMIGYREHVPGQPLARFVHRMAYAYFPQPLPPEQLAPDSYLKWALILDGDPIYYDGSGARMDWHDGFAGHVPPQQGIVATSEAPVRCVMVNFFPSAFHQLFHVPLHRFNGRMEDPEHLLGDRIERLYAQLRSISDPEVMFQHIDEFLLEQVRPEHGDQRTPIEDLEQYIREKGGMVQVAELADRCGLSQRQLQRRFKEEIGIGPKEFCSIVRFNRAYAQMQQHRRLDIDVAISCGYYDESHLLKDFAYYLGKAPKRFASMIRPMVDANLGR